MEDKKGLGFRVLGLRVWALDLYMGLILSWDLFWGSPSFEKLPCIGMSGLGFCVYPPQAKKMSPMQGAKVPLGFDVMLGERRV